MAGRAHGFGGCNCNAEGLGMLTPNPARLREKGKSKPFGPPLQTEARRLRILCGGQIEEDIDQYGRLHEMYHMMKPSEKRENDSIEGVGDPDEIQKEKERVLCFPPLSGLLCQENIVRSNTHRSKLNFLSFPVLMKHYLEQAQSSHSAMYN